MRDVLLDFRNCTEKKEMHEIIRRALDLPEWYGANLDALWDVLMGMTELPVHFCVLCTEETSQIMALERILDTIIDASKERKEITIEVIKV